MEVFITSDSRTDSGVGEVAQELHGQTKRHFLPKDYGGGLRGVAVVLMCRDPSLNFKRRLRLARMERIIYMDVMLELARMQQADHAERARIILGRLLDEVPAIVRKYSIKQFDEAAFIEDLTNWLTEFGATYGFAREQSKA